MDLYCRTKKGKVTGFNESGLLEPPVVYLYLSSLVVDARDRASDTVSKLYLALQSTVQVRPGVSRA